MEYSPRLVWSAYIFVSVFVFAPSVRYVEGASPQASHSAEELCQQISSALKKMDSLRVKYRGTSLINNSDGSYIMRELVVKRPHWFHHKGAHGSANLEWSDDPDQQHAWVQDDRYFNEFPLRRTYFSKQWGKNRSLPGTLQGEQWFELTGIWLLDARDPPLCFDLVPVFEVIAESEDYSFVRPELENVEGRWCHVLEHPGVDTLWLDASRNSCLVQREVNIPGSDRLFAKVEIAKHTEVLPDVWIPLNIRSRGFSWETGIRVAYIDAEFEVLELKVNDVIDDEFQYTPKPGSIFYSEGSSGEPKRVVNPGGLDYLDDITEWIKRVHGAPQPLVAISGTTQHLIVAIIAFALVVVVEMFRFRACVRRPFRGPFE